MNFIKNLFKLEKKPKRGILPFEWVIIGYAVITLLIVFFAYTKVANPQAMIWGRMRIVATLLALWAVYRMLPCRFTLFLRVLLQMTSLAWWYSDTYEINRMLPNLDHKFAALEQTVFGCQPALLFAQKIPNHIFSELMDLGYASYFPLIVITLLFYFVFRYKEFEKATFVIIASFFIYYLIFIFLPVTGPQYYYGAAGLDNISNGIFPNVHDYFYTHQQRLTSPGWSDGIFYHMVENAHNAGERPTAAFPSSHVGITMVLLMLGIHSGNKRLVYFIMPFFVLMFFATIYIQAHYAIDAIAGLISGAMLYFTTMWMFKKV